MIDYDWKLILERVRHLTNRDLVHKSMPDLVLSANEELGEFSRELKIANKIFGNSHKEPSEDGTIGEAVDVIIMALALYYGSSFRNNSDATDNLSSLVLKKLDKWENNQEKEIRKQ